jgi:hypothetical protein
MHIIVLVFSMLGMVKPSWTTLVDLRLNDCDVWTHFEDNDNEILWTLRFPSLKALEIGEWWPDLLGPRGVVTDFFMAHTNTLDIIRCCYRPFGKYLSRMSFAITDGKLVLRSIHTQTCVIWGLLQSMFVDQITASLLDLEIRISEIHSITKLINDFRSLESETAINGAKIPRSRPFPAARRLILWLEEELDPYEMQSLEIDGLIEYALELCGPNLRELTLMVVCPISSPDKRLREEYFSNFKKFTIPQDVIRSKSRPQIDTDAHSAYPHWSKDVSLASSCNEADSNGLCWEDVAELTGLRWGRYHDT